MRILKIVCVFVCVVCVCFYTRGLGLNDWEGWTAEIGLIGRLRLVKKCEAFLSAD